MERQFWLGDPSRIEHKIHSALRQYQIPVKYKEKGIIKEATELFECSFKDAQKIAADVISGIEQPLLQTQPTSSPASKL